MLQFIQFGMIGLTLSASAVVWAQQPELIVETDSQSIYESESILYRITLNNVEEPKPPMLDGFDDFEVASLGEQSLDSRQITIINGVRREVVRRGRQYDFRLTPKRVGTLTIPAPKAQVDGAELIGETVTLRVKPPEAQDIVLLNATTNRANVYPTQPFTLTLTISVKALPDTVRDRDPMTVQSQPPELSIPWFVEERIPSGIEPEGSWREILEPLISRRSSGFQINALRNSSVFSMFERDALGFHPIPKRSVHQDSSGIDADYWDYVFKRTFIPKKVGNYDFGPITLKGTFGTGFTRGKLKGEELYVAAKGLIVNVREVPLEGRPAAFIGAVGSFKIASELSPTTANVGDPMTLTLSLSGPGTLADARPPEIAKLPGIEGAFRTYEATTETRGDSRRFIYSLRPMHTQVEQFPSIPVAYFDVEQDAYVTVATEPVPVTINAAEALSDTQILAAPNSGRPTTNDLQASSGGLFANDTNPARLRNEAVTLAPWLTTWLAMFGIYLLAVLVAAQIRRQRADPSLARRRSAATNAKTALTQAKRMRDSQHWREASDQLRRAVVGLVADHLDKPSQGLTASDVELELERAGVEPELRDSTQRFLHACDAARYGAAVEDVATLEQQAGALVNRLQSQLRSSRGPWARTATIILLGTLTTIVGCGTAADLESTKQFQETENLFAQAKTSEEFRRVASQYQQLLDQGLRSGAVYYNQGNAWMRAGKWDAQSLRTDNPSD